MGVLSRLRRSKKGDSSSVFCCSNSEVGSECSSLRQDVYDSLQQQPVPVPSHALDQWSFPSARSGLRNDTSGSNGGSRLFSRFTSHGAAIPAEETRAMARTSSGGGCAGTRTDHVAQQLPPRAASSCGQHASGVCCCCSDSSTHSGASNERLDPGKAGSSAAFLQQHSEQKQQQPMGMVLNVPTLIESRGVKCLILDAPTNENLQAYLVAMRKVGVTDLVRTCAPTYNDGPVFAAGIRVHDLTFPDGEAPPVEIIRRWRNLATKVRAEGGVLAVHCVAGLGRGPVLVAISLIDSGFDPEEAVHFIRSRRKGAINRRQLAFLHNYRRHAVASRRCIRGCTIM